MAPAPGSFTESNTDGTESGEVVSPTVITGLGVPNAGRVPEFTNSAVLMDVGAGLGGLGVVIILIMEIMLC